MCTARIRTNVVSQSLVLTRTMDYWGRTGGVSIVRALPLRGIELQVPTNAAVSGVSDVGFLWQMNIFGGPALTREEFANFVPQTFASFHLYVGTPLGEYRIQAVRSTRRQIDGPFVRPSTSATRRTAAGHGSRPTCQLRPSLRTTRSRLEVQAA